MLASSSGVAPLVDAEWRFGVTASTDDVGRAGSAFVQAKLLVDAGNGRLASQHVEMSVPMFYDLLAQLEKAKSYVDYLDSA